MRFPIRLSARRSGQKVSKSWLPRCSRASRSLPGWVWATDVAGNDGYVPEEILKPLGNGRYSAAEAFDPAVLTIRRGDPLQSLRQIHGWHWCRNGRGEEGWVAGYLLRPV